MKAIYNTILSYINRFLNKYRTKTDMEPSDRDPIEIFKMTECQFKKLCKDCKHDKELQPQTYLDNISVYRCRKCGLLEYIPTNRMVA